MADVEARVNDVVIEDLAVHAEVMTQSEAIKAGAMALFGEKYGDQVRVISVGDWARELCGGTHAVRSGQLGVVKLMGESSIGSGVRRVEALVGGDAYRFLAREHVLVAQLSEALKVRPEELPERVDDIVERLRAAEKEIDRIRVQQLLAAGAELAAGAADVAGVKVVAHRVEGAAGGDVRTLALDVRGRLPAGAAWGRGRDRHQRRQGVGRGGDQRRGPGARPERERAGPRDRAAGRRQGRRQGRRRPGRRHRHLPRRRGAGAGSDRGRQGGDRRMRMGVRLGIDPGDARIGVARSDPSGFLASPVETVRRGKGDLRRIARILEESEAVEVVVGMPRSLSGGEGPAAAKSRVFARSLASRVAPVPVRLVDERLTTVSAEAMLRDRGRKGSDRRAVVDQAAAVLILQHALDTERQTGRPPGEIVEETHE